MNVEDDSAWLPLRSMARTSYFGTCATADPYDLTVFPLRLTSLVAPSPATLLLTTACSDGWTAP